MHARGLRTLAGIAAALIAGLALSTSAGPLDPPSGPVAATGKTMIFSLPYTITAPGSYELARSLTAPGAPSANGITISSSDVTLDLGGNTLTGVNPQHSGLSGIAVSPGVSEVTIRNGVITGWPSGGISAASAGRLRIERLSLFANADTGGTSRGLQLGDRCEVSDCTVLESTGISGGSNVVIRDCVVHGGGSFQVAPIVVGAAAVIRGCSVQILNDSSDSTPAISAGAGSAIADCAVRVVGGPTSASGIGAGSGSTITRCAVSVTGGLTQVYGISTGTGGSACECTVSGQFLGSGILAQSSATVTGCTIGSSGVGGISANASATGCRIDSNQVDVAVGPGVSIAGARNIILRNTVHGGVSAYSIAAGNSFGPIVDVTSAGDVSLNPAAAHPWANFRY